MKKLITITLFLFLGMSIQAQDFVFSQFQLSPLNLNPALTGVSGSDQFIANYRTQWDGERDNSGLSFYSISYDRPFKLKNGDRIGVGGRYSSVDTYNQNLNSFSTGISLSYQKHFSNSRKKNQYLLIGAESVYGKTYLDFGEPYTDHGPFGEFTEKYPDFSFGVGYKYEFDERNSTQIGFAVTHAFNPDLNGLEYYVIGVERRFTSYVMIDFPISKRLDIRPRFFLTKVDSYRAMIGTIGLRYVNANHQFELGGGWKYNGRLSPIYEQNAATFNGTYFFKKIGFSIAKDFLAFDSYNSKINTFEASIIVRRSW